MEDYDLSSIRMRKKECMQDEGAGEERSKHPNEEEYALER